MTMSTDDDLPDDLINATAAARLAHCHISCLHRWRLARKLRGWRRCGRWFYSRSELLRMFQAPREPPPLPPTEAELKRRAEAATAELRRRGWKV